MFCKKCGNEINDDVTFCMKCGASVKENGRKNDEEKFIEDNNVVKSIKPTYVVPYKIITTGLRTLVLLFIFGFYIFEDGMLILLENFGVIIFLLMAVYIIVKLLLEKKQYEQLEYNFYKTKVEYVDGFLNKEQKELKYKSIRETTFSQNVFEKMFNIGKIRIFTNASSGIQGGRHNNGMNNGLIIHCVLNPKEQYESIKRLIDENEDDE